MEIRFENVNDHAAIHALVAAAFGRDQEAGLVDDLRAAGDLAVSLVAEAGLRLHGQAAMSRLRSPSGALALAPVSVSPGVQRRGIGSALIRKALDCARGIGTPVVFVLGEPDYYKRFGFSTAAAETFPSQYAGPYFMALRFCARSSEVAPVVYPDAFQNLK